MGSNRPTELIAIHEDDTWDLVVGEPRMTPDGLKFPLSGLGNGFGNWANGHFWRMASHDGQLYVGTWDWSVGFQDFSSGMFFDVVDRLFTHHYGFDLFRTDDGIHWTPITQSGLGDPHNTGVRSMESTPDGLFLGTARQRWGTQLFRKIEDPAPEPIAAPQRLKAESEAISGRTVNLSWEPSPAAMQYRVYRSMVKPLDELFEEIFGEGEREIDVPGPQGATITMNLEDIQGGALSYLCPGGRSITDTSCAALETLDNVNVNSVAEAEEPPPFPVAFPLSYQHVAVVLDTAYSEPAPTALQSLYFVRAEDALGNLSQPSNLVGGPAKVLLPPPLPTTTTTSTTTLMPGSTTTTSSTTTTTFLPDEDGVADKIEDQAPNHGDGNADGIADRYQNNVTSLRSTGNGEFVTLVSPEGTELAEVRTMGNPAPDTHPLDVKFSMGFLCFTVTNLHRGTASVTVEILRHGTVHEVNTYWKYGRTSDDPQPHWYEFLFDGTTGAEIFGDRILIHLVDGQRGDDDLTVNGQILDPGGPGFLVPNAVPGFLELGGAGAQSIQVATSGLQEDDENFVGVAVFNPNDKVNGVSFSAVNAAGSEVARIELEGGLPARVTLPPKTSPVSMLGFSV